MRIELSHPVTKDLASEAIKKMRVIIDSREKENTHIVDYLKAKGIPFDKRKLEYGDYSCEIQGRLIGLEPIGEWLSFEKKVVVERKKDIDEIAMCVGKERDRFENEFLRIKADGVKCVLMLEKFSYDSLMETGGLFDRSYTQMKPDQIMLHVNQFSARYNLHPITLINNQHSGRILVSVLSRYAYQYLTE